MPYDGLFAGCDWAKQDIEFALTCDELRLVPLLLERWSEQ
jgi:hypothetical protein